MKVRASVYDSEQDYTDDLNCNVYAFDGSSDKEYEEFLHLLAICLKHSKVVVIHKIVEDGKI